MYFVLLPFFTVHPPYAIWNLITFVIKIAYLKAIEFKLVISK